MALAETLARPPVAKRLALVAVTLVLIACAAFAMAFHRDALNEVVRACVADAGLTCRSYPCLAVDLSGGEERGHVLLRPPWSNDLILSPTRPIVGIEDPVLQLPDAPNYFAEAWRARAMIATANGAPPARDQIALFVNSRLVRDQDQLHIHIGCLKPKPRRNLIAAAPGLTPGVWNEIDPIIPHQPVLAMRIRSADLAGVSPFRLVHEALDGVARSPADEVIMAVGARVDGHDEFLIVASYAGLPHSWWPLGGDGLIDKRCRGEADAGR